uniref:CX domain-containing protein n=1 Tax=Rhabditophanes sp. KR3021 TaxID=114890 RepID=A0AC35UHL6_9BILA
MSSTFQVSGGTPSGDNEVRQHGSIGRFSNSVNDGPDSSFIKCIYFDKYNSNLTVPVLCQKPLGCCTEGCCPRDTLSTQCLFILLGFVLLVFLGGCCIWIISYQKSKLEQRKNEREYYREREYEDNMSQAGGYHHHQAMPYSVYGTGVPG